MKRVHTRGQLASLVAGIGTLLVATAPLAAEWEKTAFDELDRDQDGILTVKEVSQHNQIREAWGTMDLDQDGVIDRAEFSMFEVQENERDDLMDPTTEELKEVYKD